MPSAPSSITRRRFLKTSAAALALPQFIPAGILAAGRNPGAHGRLILGLIGMGGMGLAHLRAMLERAGQGQVGVAAVCDVDEKRLQAAAQAAGPRTLVFRDYRYVLQRKDVDAVILAAPDHWHGVQFVHAAECGKHIYCEKPACSTIEEGKAMIAAAEKNKTVAQIGSQGRSQPEAYLMHRFLANGGIGKIKRVDCWHYPSPVDDQPVPNGDPPPELDWDLWLGPLRWRPYNPRYLHGTFRWVMDCGGGQICDRGAHLFSCVLGFLDADGAGPVTVEATGTLPTKGLWDTAVTMNVTYTFKNPDWVLTWNQPGKPVPPEERPADAPKIEQPRFGAVYQGDKGTVTQWGGDGGLWVDDKVRNWQPPPDAVEVPKSPGHYEDWFSAVKTGGKTIMNVAAGVGVANLCNLGNLAFLLGRTLRWDQAKQEIIADDEARRLMSRPQRFPYHL
ncbi:MAG: Gfo/Idh/MocA family oxidoreductase [Pirellulales bacterium]|nr:Gfo/Idh/MocA family oxidoreductase [Pirellulales bacterium]